VIAVSRSHRIHAHAPADTRAWAPASPAGGDAGTRRRLHAIASAALRHWLLVLGLASFIGLVAAVNPPELGRAFRDVHVVPLLLMVPVAFASYAARGLGWRVALRRIGVRIGYLRSIAVMIAGQALVFLPAGDLGRVALVVETGSDGHAPGEVAGTITFQELLFMSLVGAAVIPIVVLHPAYASAVIALTVLDAAIAVTLLSERVFTRVLSIADRVPLVRRFDSDIRRLRDAFVACVDGRTTAAVAAFSGLAAGLGFLLFELSLRAVGVDELGVANAAFIYGLGHLVGAASMLPGGLGAYEGLLTGYLAIHGVPAWQGASAALLYRAANDVLMALVGLGVGSALRLHSARAASTRSVPQRLWAAGENGITISTGGLAA
jgi:uncharacterized membrane protein YbhN (UPF0104 family)